MASADTLAQTADNDTPDTLIRQGSDLSDAVFGSASGQISGALAQFSGVKPTSASSLLSMAGSVITGLVGRQLMAQGEEVKAGSLERLLSDQREAVTAAMPAGLSSLLGTNADSGEMAGMVGGLAGAASSPVTGAAIAMGTAMSAGAMVRLHQVRGRVVYPVRPPIAIPFTTGPTGSISGRGCWGRWLLVCWCISCAAVAMVQIPSLQPQTIPHRRRCPTLPPLLIRWPPALKR